jgi:putative nucleotidyltransferase with HDIG domain
MMFGWMTSLLLIPMVYTVYRTYSSQMAFVRDREQHAKDTEALHLRTIEGLAMAIEAKDQNTHKHLLRVRVYVAELGKRMGLEEPIMQALLIASYLHDIGKLAVPEYIINKPGKLTVEEFEKMKIHPVVGADILERVRFPYPVVPIVRSHHESWDGSGYPDGLKGEEIPIGARLLTAVDCFDALASERPYRKAMPLQEAMAFLKARAGIQFDPQIVQLLAENYLELEEKARQQIGSIQPLKTDITIVRGAAPGAGFEPERSAMESNQRPAGAPELAVAARHEAAAITELEHRLARVSSARELNSILSAQLRRLISHDCFALYLRSGDVLLPQFVGGESAAALSMLQLPLGEGLSGWVAEHARPIVNGNPTVEPNYLPDAGIFTGASSALSVPLFAQNGALKGSVLGVITLYAVAAAAFSKDQLGVVEALESRLAQAFERSLGFSVEDNTVGTRKNTDTERAKASPVAL